MNPSTAPGPPATRTMVLSLVMRDFKKNAHFPGAVRPMMKDGLVFLVLNRFLFSQISHGLNIALIRAPDRHAPTSFLWVLIRCNRLCLQNKEQGRQTQTGWKNTDTSHDAPIGLRLKCLQIIPAAFSADTASFSIRR